MAFNSAHTYFHSSDSLLYLLKFSENDAYLAMHLCLRLQAIPLTMQLTHLAGELFIVAF